MVALNGTDARVLAYARAGRVQRLYGEAFSNGPTPAASVEAFLEANADFLGVTPENLRDRDVLPMMFGLRARA